jgi:GTP-binding protein
MNVFRLPTFYLVDLPGYGYAKASHAERTGFRKLLDAYLAKREHLVGVVWLLDIRHPPSAEDRVVQEVLAASGRPTLAVLTKGDKLTRNQRLKAAAERAAELGLDRHDLLVTSSQTGEGITDLADSVLAAVG